MSRKDRRRAAPRVGPPLTPRETPSTTARPARAAAAVLLLRFFFGGTFLYAGFDKLITPSFLDPTNAASIGAQMAAFARVSPLGGLIRLSQPFATPIGLVIAIAEIAIGLGALTGLAFRLASIGGAALSVLFFLTVSWTTHPFYYGADLPYAIGWATLALAGPGGRLVPRSILGLDDRTDLSPGRRELLKAGWLALGAIATASIALPFRADRLDSDEADATPSPSIAATPAATIPSGAIAIAAIADVQKTGAFAFMVPFDAPAPLPAGDPGVIVGLPDGTFVAFDAVCTHAGCTVEWDRTDAVLLCPCHSATFDPAHQAAVLGGPTDQPLASLPLVIDEAGGRILLKV
jgi:thiosulfate dehydrogenase (quinone) large subunit